MQKRFVKYGFVIFFVTFQNLLSQYKYVYEGIDCDSIAKASETMWDIFVEQMPTPIKPYIEIQNEFLSLIDTNNFTNSIFVRIFIDTSGNVLCSRIIKGNKNSIDTVALDYVLNLKFNPAVARKKKFQMSILIPFYSGITGAKDWIKKNGKWAYKNKE